MSTGDAGQDAETVLCRAPDVIAVHVGEVMVLHDPRGDRYVRLNESGELVWERLGQPRSLSELGATLAERYRLPPARALKDAQRLTSGLLERGMLVSVPAPGRAPECRGR